MKPGYFPTEFEVDLKKFMDRRLLDPPWFRLEPLLSVVDDEARPNFVPCLYLLVLFYQAVATYRLAHQPPWGRRDTTWNMGGGSTAFPKYGPGGVGRAHMPPHEIFAEACELGLYQDETLNNVLGLRGIEWVI